MSTRQPRRRGRGARRISVQPVPTPRGSRGDGAGRPTRNRGRCDFCAGEYQLRRDGGVRVHTIGEYDRAPDGAWRPRYCPGSALPPRVGPAQPLDRGALLERIAATNAALEDALDRALGAVNDLRRDNASDRGREPERDRRQGPGSSPRRETDR